MTIQYSVRNISIDPGLVLSPMSGVTTTAFRRLIKELNPGSVGLLISEFISVEGMTRKIKKTLDMMRFDKSERPYCIQIFGYDPQRMSDAARMVEDFGADIVDINCGCPAPKVVRKGGGCELMRQPDHLKMIFREVKRGISIPLTMKMRSGWDSESLNCVEIARIAEGEGVEAIAIHGRTRAQLYRGFADWSVVSEVAKTVSIPVLGSGDVVDYDSAMERLAHGAHGLYIGRAALSNPFIFQEISSGERRSVRGDTKGAVSVLKRYIELLKDEFPPIACVGKLKQLASQMCRGHVWRKELLLVNKLELQQDVLERALDEHHIQESISTSADLGPA